MDKDVIRRNRAFLNSITHWIDDEDYRQSHSHYGCPPRVFPLLNLPINDEPTYTDLIVTAARRLDRPVSYLELGVSVGKNFYVVANALEGASLVGFDWEAINPVLERRFKALATDGPVRRYRYLNNTISYLQGDISLPDNWAFLQGPKFNLVFSDASHNPDAVLHEFDMLRARDLLDGRAFVLIWDDLDRNAKGAMTQAFHEIFSRLCKEGLAEPTGMFLTELNGWLGEHEHKHTVGVINNIGLTAASL